MATPKKAKASRSLSFSKGKSDKFWRIELRRSSHTVTFGRTGTTGQTKTKDFPDADTAQHAYDKLVASKLKEGYVDSAATNGSGEKASRTKARRSRAPDAAPPKQRMPASPEETYIQRPKARKAKPVADSWKRLEAWLNANLPETADDLAPGCSAAQIADFEKEFKLRLPDDVKESLRIHNGQKRDIYPGALGGGPLDGLEESLLSPHYSSPLVK